MAFRSQTFVAARPGLRDSGRPAPVKGMSTIRQGVTAYPLILIFPDPLQFLSHKSSVKVNTASLKDSLALYGISCFVAHEDIHPTKEWMDEIESALFSMDALVALMTDDFHDSDWTDQEVGVAMGRCVPIISVKLGKMNPYGFIGRFQALSCTWEKAPLELMKLLICHEKMKEAFIAAVSSCSSFDRGNALASVLPFISSLSESQADALIEAYKNNPELRGSFGFNGSKPRYYGEGLQHHISRATGKDYKPIFDSLPWIGDVLAAQVAASSK